MIPTDRSTAPTSDHLVGLADKVADHLQARTLPKSRWTHEGHLLACISLVRRLGPVDALAALRAAIPPYNESTGVANTPTGGYHDTITAYFVWAVHRLLEAGESTTAIMWHPLCDREALLRWWDRATLKSPAARAHWVAPTKVPAGPSPKEWVQPVATVAVSIIEPGRHGRRELTRI